MTMTEHEQLAQLLQAAGRSEPPAEEPHAEQSFVELTQKVYLRAQRKSRSRRMALRTLTIFCLVAAGGWLWHAQTKETPIIKEDFAKSSPVVTPSNKAVSDGTVPKGTFLESESQMRAEIARLEKEIQQTLLIAQQALRLQKMNSKMIQQRLQKKPTFSLEMARAEIEKTAFLLVDRGDQLGRQPDRRQAQIDSYQRAVDLFSETSWAQTAQQRLAELENQ